MLVPAASADGSFQDPNDADPDAVDLSLVVWRVAPTMIEVNLTFYADPDLAAWSYVGAVFLGTPDAPEPDEWYVFSVDSREAVVFAGHPNETANGTLRVMADATRLGLEFDRVEPVPAACDATAARTGRFTENGFELLDAAPDQAGDLGGAWSEGLICAQVEPAPGESPAKETGAPALGAAGLACAIWTVSAVMKRRRS